MIDTPGPHTAEFVSITDVLLLIAGIILLIIAPLTALIIWAIKRAKHLPENESTSNDHPPHD